MRDQQYVPAQIRIARRNQNKIQIEQKGSLIFWKQENDWTKDKNNAAIGSRKHPTRYDASKDNQAIPKSNIKKKCKCLKN